MSRARTRKHQEKEDFFQENPALRPAPEPEPEILEGLSTYELSVEDTGEGFIAVGLLNGEVEFDLKNGGYVLNGPDFDLYFSVNSSLGENGFGAPTASGGFDMTQTVTVALYADNDSFPGAQPPLSQDPDPVSFADFELDFLATGDGTISVQFYEFMKNGDSIVFDHEVASNTQTPGEFNVDLPDDYVTRIANINFTGDVEVFLTGIDFGVNFVSGFGMDPV